MTADVGPPVDERRTLHPGVLPLGTRVDDLLDLGRFDIVLSNVRLALVTPDELSPHVTTLGDVLRNATRKAVP